MVVLPFIWIQVSERGKYCTQPWSVSPPKVIYVRKIEWEKEGKNYSTVYTYNHSLHMQWLLYTALWIPSRKMWTDISSIIRQLKPMRCHERVPMILDSFMSKVLLMFCRRQGIFLIFLLCLQYLELDYKRFMQMWKLILNFLWRPLNDLLWVYVHWLK